jgi:hypothetical protein
MSSGAPPSRSNTESGAALDLYVSALAVTKQHFDALARGELPRLSALERTAQALAASAANAAYALAIPLSASGRDDASRAVQAAMLALSVARRTTRNPRALRRIALAALLVDAGRARIAGREGLDLGMFRLLPDNLDAEVPTESAALGMSEGASQVVEAAAVTAFETAWLERPRLGRLYAGRVEPRMSTRLLFAVRSFLEHCSPRASDEPQTPFEALRRLVARGGEEAPVLRLLADAVGLVPVGSVVELSSGQWAIVAPPAAAEPERPRVRVLTDLAGRALERPPLLDLGAPPESGKALPRVVRVVPAREARFNLTQAFFGGGG